MRFLVLIFVLLTGSVTAAAQTPNEYPPGAPNRVAAIKWVKMSWLTRNQRYARYKYEDMDIFWPTLIADKSKPDCGTTRSFPEILVKQAPNYRVTREMLWNDFRPKINQRFQEICGVEHTGTVVANFYFDTLYRGGDQLFLGVPSGTGHMPHYLPSFAEAIFNNSERPDGNDRLELFAPTIFGYVGKGEHASFYIQYPNRVDAESGKTGFELVQAGYDDFPNFNFVDVLIWDIGLRELMAQQRQARDDLIAKLIGRGAIEMFSRQRACFDSGSCGEEDLPILLLH